MLVVCRVCVCVCMCAWVCVCVFMLSSLLLECVVSLDALVSEVSVYVVIFHLVFIQLVCLVGSFICVLVCYVCSIALSKSQTCLICKCPVRRFC